MMYSEIVSGPSYTPHGNNQYAVGQTGISSFGYNLMSCIFPHNVTDTNRFDAFDEDPLTDEEIADLDQSHRDLREGRYKLLSKDLSDEDFLANF